MVKNAFTSSAKPGKSSDGPRDQSVGRSTAKGSGIRVSQKPGVFQGEGVTLWPVGTWRAGYFRTQETLKTQGAQVLVEDTLAYFPTLLQERCSGLHMALLTGGTLCSDDRARNVGLAGTCQPAGRGPESPRCLVRARRPLRLGTGPPLT